uniref:30S ribosomal protein S2 n=1 Tax=Lygus hesperus TaxID=30085 RepID=A0A0A9Z8X2_LYGHE
MKKYVDNRRHAKHHSIEEGDKALVRQPKVNKYTTNFDPNPYNVIAIKGTQVTAVRDGKTLVRNASMFKRIPNPTEENSGEVAQEEEGDQAATNSNTPPSPPWKGWDSELGKARRSVDPESEDTQATPAPAPSVPGIPPFTMQLRPRRQN